MSDDLTYEEARSRVAELTAENRRLRRLLDQKDAPAELRHRLRSTLAILRTVIRRSAEGSRELKDYVAHLEDRLDAIVRAQAMADMHGGVDLRMLLSEEFLHYSLIEGDGIELVGPDLMLSPRAGQALAIAFHELVINAVEHGANAGSPKISVQWTVADNKFTLQWTEEARYSSSQKQTAGFGHHFILNALPYQLDATTSLEVDNGAINCFIEMPLSGLLIA